MKQGVIIAVVLFVFTNFNLVTAQGEDNLFKTAHPEGYRNVKPNIDTYPKEGMDFQNKKLEENKNSTTYTYDWIAYAYVSCEVKWDEYCEGEFLIEAPAGWQACKALYSVSSISGRGARYHITPENWYTNDPQSPDRFRAFKFYIFASGSGLIFDRWGAWVKLSDVGIRLIPASATNRDRYAAGCTMPAHD